jgi:carbamoyltransferase
MSHILGISAYYHDSAAVLVKDHEICAAAQEERFTRIKHDHSFPENAIDFCLKSAQITPDELTAIVFYDKPFLKFERILDTYLHYAPRGFSSFIKAIPLWIKKKIWIKALIAESFPQFKGELLFTLHHQAHAASAFYPSPFHEAAIVTVDGVGEWTTTSIWHGKGQTLTMLKEMRFPHSLGLLYSAFTYYCGFKVNSGEYKLMGLAPYGDPVYADIIRTHLIDIKEDGSFHLNMDYFNYTTGLTMTNRTFEKRFGFPPRHPDDPLKKCYMDLARSVQEITNEIMLKIAKHACKVTGCDTLCLAGGVALNCVANRLIAESGYVKDLWIQPAAGDAGGALGAALCAWYDYYGNDRISPAADMQKGSLLGPAYPDEAIEAFLRENRVVYHPMNEENLIKRTARLISEQKVAGWFQGRMEFGPRALGNRSILADPRSPDMQKQLNLKIKYRESFRPFAPSILEEYVSEYFKTDKESPYMLLISDLHENKRIKQIHDTGGLSRLSVQRSAVPAVTHVDYTARLQTVSKEVNGLFHKLISAFYTLTGCPLLVNTSFNVRGEPIVNTPEDAFRCFMNTEMDVLAMGHFLILKEEQEHLDRNAWKIRYDKD